jgi:type II secretory pathway pseudopilin PulG
MAICFDGRKGDGSMRSRKSRCFTPAGREGFGGREGFALTETLVATVVVGIGISAALFGFSTGIANSSEGRNLLTSENLASSIIELSRRLEYSDPDVVDIFGPEAGENVLGDFDDINDLDGLVISPPVLADGSPLASLAGWAQEIHVFPLDSGTFARLAPPVDTGVVGLEVAISNNGRTIGTYEWIVTRR